MLDPRAEYANRLEMHAERVARNERRHIRLGKWKLAMVAAALVLAWLCLARHLFPGYWLMLPVGTYAVLAILHEQTSAPKSKRKPQPPFTVRDLQGSKTAGAAPARPATGFGTQSTPMRTISIFSDAAACLNCFQPQECPWAKTVWLNGFDRLRPLRWSLSGKDWSRNYARSWTCTRIWR